MYNGAVLVHIPRKTFVRKPLRISDFQRLRGVYKNIVELRAVGNS